MHSHGLRPVLAPQSSLYRLKSSAEWPQRTWRACITMVGGSCPILRGCDYAKRLAATRPAGGELIARERWGSGRLRSNARTLEAVGRRRRLAQRARDPPALRWRIHPAVGGNRDSISGLTVSPPVFFLAVGVKIPTRQKWSVCPPSVANQQGVDKKRRVLARRYKNPPQSNRLPEQHHLVASDRSETRSRTGGYRADR